jgi:hypothetical protein
LGHRFTRFPDPTGALSQPEETDEGSQPHAELELFEPTKRNFMILKITSRAACLAELTSNPKSFFNCPDLHGGSGLAEKIPLLDPTDNDVNASTTTDLLRRETGSCLKDSGDAASYSLIVTG